MNRLLSLFYLMVLQGCSVLSDAQHAVTLEARPSEAARIVIRNGASREIYVGKAPLIVLLKPSQEWHAHPYSVRIEMLSPGTSRELSLNYDQAGWAVANGETAPKRRLPYGVLSVSMHGPISAFPADEWNANLAQPRLDTPVGPDELVVILTNEASPKMAMTPR